MGLGPYSGSLNSATDFLSDQARAIPWVVRAAWGAIRIAPGSDAAWLCLCRTGRQSAREQHCADVATMLAIWALAWVTVHGAALCCADLPHVPGWCLGKWVWQEGTCPAGAGASGELCTGYGNRRMHRYFTQIPPAQRY